MSTRALLAAAATPFKEQLVLTSASHIQRRVLIVSTTPPINICNSNPMEFSFQQF
jgi:hypothetical protein